MQATSRCANGGRPGRPSSSGSVWGFDDRPLRVVPRPAPATGALELMRLYHHLARRARRRSRRLLDELGDLDLGARVDAA